MKHTFQRSIVKLNTLVLAGSVALVVGTAAQAAVLSFDGQQSTNVTTHSITATDWADYVGGNTTFTSANAGGRLYWRTGPDPDAGDGQYMHFDLTTLTNLTLVAPATVTLQDANPTWGGGVDGSYVATVDSAWTAGGGQNVTGASPIFNAVNATGSYGWDASVSWSIGYTTFEYIVANQASLYGLAVIGGSGSQLHFDSPMNPYLTVKTGTLIPLTGVITADTGSSTWNPGNYIFSAASAYSPVHNTLTIGGELIAGTSGAGTVTINSNGTVAVSQAGSVNYYWAIDSTTINAGGKLTINGHSNMHNLTLAGGELASTGTDASWGSWGLPDATSVTGGVASTISAQQISLSSGIFNVASGSTLNFTGSTRAGSLTKNGAGTLKIFGWQNYGDGTTVNAGTLEVAGQSGGNGWLRGAVTVNAGGTLLFTGGDGTGFGWNSSATRLTLDGGTFDAASGAHVGFGNYMTMVVTNGATISGSGQWNGDGLLGFRSSGDSTNTLNGSWVLRADNGANHTFDVADGASDVDLLVNANLFDQYPEVWWVAPSVLVKDGPGTLVLSGMNSYNGGTVVKGGTLSLATSTSKPSAGTLTVESGTLRIENVTVLDPAAQIKVSTGATLNLAFDGTNTINTLFLDNIEQPPGIYSSNTEAFVVGPGCLYISEDDGVWTAATDGNWSAAANWLDTVIANGKGATASFIGATGLNVTLDSARYLANLVFSNANYTITGSSSLTLQVYGGVQPLLDVAAGQMATLDVLLAGAQGMEKSGGGTAKLTKVNSYTGGTIIDAGTLELAGASGGTGLINGKITVNPGATLAITGGDGTGFGWYNAINSLAVTGGTVTAQSSHIGFGTRVEVVLNSGSTLAGNWNWNGDNLLGFNSSGDSMNTISGSLNLRCDNGAYHTFTVADGASAIDLLVSADLTDQYPSPYAADWARALLVKAGPGVMVLSGTASYDGETYVNDGALYINGAGVSNVTVAAGKTLGGSGTIIGTLTLGAGTLIDPGAAPGETGTLTLGTALTLSGMTLRIDTTPAGDNDTLALTGDVSLDGLTIDCSGATLNQSKTYTLLTATGTLTGVPTLIGDTYSWNMKIEGNALVLRFEGTIIRLY